MLLTVVPNNICDIRTMHELLQNQRGEYFPGFHFFFFEKGKQRGKHKEKEKREAGGSWHKISRYNKKLFESLEVWLFYF